MPPSLTIPATNLTYQLQTTSQFGVSVDAQAPGTVQSTSPVAGTNYIQVNVSNPVFTSSMKGEPVILGAEQMDDGQPVVINGQPVVSNQPYIVESYISNTCVDVSSTASNSSGSTYSIVNGPFSIPILSTLLNVPDVCLEPITIGYAGSSSLTPELFVNGSQTLTGSTPVASGTTVDVVLQSIPAQTAGVVDESQCFRIVRALHACIHPHGWRRYCHRAGGLANLGILAGGRAVAANAAQIKEADSDSPTDNLLTGGLLSLAINEYFTQGSADEQTLAGITGGIPLYNVVSSGIATAYSATVEQNTSVEFPYLPGAANIDAADCNYLAFSNNESSITTTVNGITYQTADDEARYNLIGCNYSSLEGLVLEEVTNITGISSMKSLQTAANSTTVSLSNLNTTEVPTWWTAIPTGIQNSVVQFVDEGDDVMMPEATTQIGSGTTAWTGLGFVVLEEPLNVAQYFILSGSIGSGPVQSEYGATVDGAPAPVISPIDTINSSTVGDPVNPANGDLTNDETDFSIPNLGTPLEMVRSYDSINTQATAGAESSIPTAAWATAGRSATATRSPSATTPTAA